METDGIRLCPGAGGNVRGSMSGKIATSSRHLTLALGTATKRN
jgi:hypothetical protein